MTSEIDDLKKRVDRLEERFSFFLNEAAALIPPSQQLPDVWRELEEPIERARTNRLAR